jgi:hypothetical protein
MNLLIDSLFEVLSYVPANIVNFGIIAYLIWFKQVHTNEHREILKRLKCSEDTDMKVDEKLNDIYMMSLKTAITNADLPLTVRIELYDLYKGLGGNSWVDIYAKEHLFNEKKPATRKKKEVIEE